MYERFDDRARRVVVMAQEEARLLNHDYIGTEHILLGLIHEGNGVATTALESLDISLDGIREQVQEIIGRGEQAPSGHIPFTPPAKEVLELALREALKLGHSNIGVEHILVGLIREGEGVAAQVLVKLGADLDRVRKQIDTELHESKKQVAQEDRQPAVQSEGRLLLDQFGHNLTQMARQSEFDPVIGREHEIERAMQILSRRTKYNPILIGESGVGKTTIVRGLGQAIVHGDAPEHIINKLLYALDIRSVLDISSQAKTQELKNALNEVRFRNDIILFIPDIQTIIGTHIDADDGAREVSSILKPMITRGELQVIGATTPYGYSKYIEKNNEITNQFEPILVSSPTIELTVEILKGVRDIYEAHHRVSITDDALIAAANWGHLFDPDHLLPTSAIRLLDESGARLRIVRITPPPEIKAMDGEISAVKKRKEDLINAQDFEGAAVLRDDEQKLITARADKERLWKSGSLDTISEVNENIVAEVVSGVSGDSVLGLIDSLNPIEPILESLPEYAHNPTSQYVLLGDRPIKDIHEDLLDVGASAKTIAEIINNSRLSAPFVLAVDGSWGMGKSTLLNQIESSLSETPGMQVVTYNAWTSQGQNALEGLIKSVLVELDRSSLRRWARKARKLRGAIPIVRAVMTILANIAGASRLVDQIWDNLEIDAKGRNDLRSAISGLLSDWVSKSPTIDSRRCLVVFIDDLDRCSEETIIQVCEAVKLYLDAPGLIFIIGCDLDILRQSFYSAEGSTSEARIYLEKIIQVIHRIQPPSDSGVRNLIRGYAKLSGTQDLFDDNVELILSARTGRNPRRIKRIINSFILESHLDPAWRSPKLGNNQLVTTVIIQHLYPTFYKELVGRKSQNDPIAEFLDYADVKNRASAPPATSNAWWAKVNRLFQNRDLQPPSISEVEDGKFAYDLESLEARLPDDYPRLAVDTAFISLLRGTGGKQSRANLIAHLSNESKTSDPLIGLDE